jgi:hypothetical protein
MHFQRKNERANYETADWLTGLIERDGATPDNVRRKILALDDAG